MMEKDKTRRENRNSFFTLLVAVAFYGVRFLLYKYVCVCARVVISLSLSFSL